MKTILSGAVAAAALLSAPAMAHAADIYGSIGVGIVDVSPVKLGAVQVRGGIQLTPMIGIEAEASKGISGDKVLGVNVDLNNEYGAFLTARWNFSDKGALIGRVGYASAEFEASLGPISVTDTQSGAAYGVGLEGHVAPATSIRLDWTRYSFDQDADSYAVALVHHF